MYCIDKWQSQKCHHFGRPVPPFNICQIALYELQRADHLATLTVSRRSCLSSGGMRIAVRINYETCSQFLSK